MKQFAAVMLGAVLLVAGGSQLEGGQGAEFRDLFNGKDLTGWVNVNTGPDTWTVQKGEIVCSGHPHGVLRTDRQYENFILHIEWQHIEPGGNSTGSNFTRRMESCHRSPMFTESSSASAESRLSPTTREALGANRSRTAAKGEGNGILTTSYVSTA